MQQIEIFDAVRICVDAERDTHGDRPSGVDFIQVQAQGAGVDFQGHARLFGGLQHGVHVQVRPFPVGDDPSGGMADDIHVRVADRIQQPFGHLGARLAQADVQRGDDDIQARQDLIGFFGTWVLVGIIILLLWLMVTIR